MEAEATKVRTWRESVIRNIRKHSSTGYWEGNVEFDDMPKIALQKANWKLVGRCAAV